MSNLRNVKTAQYQAKLLYGADIKDDDFEELVLVALPQIGNHHTELKTVRLNLDDNLCVDLPCDCKLIESVTYDYEDPWLSSNIHETGDIGKTHTENYIEGKKLFQNMYYQHGRLAKFQEIGRTLRFDRNYGPITLKYHAELQDEEGLPLVNDKEINAIAAFCAYYSLYKKGLQTNNQNILKISEKAERDWINFCSQARNPEWIDQNTANKILDAKSSLDRKVYNKSYKPIK